MLANIKKYRFILISLAFGVKFDGTNVINQW